MSIVLPGWDCASCRAFNGAAKEWLTHCRSCGAPCPDAQSPPADQAIDEPSVGDGVIEVTKEEGPCRSS